MRIVLTNAAVCSCRPLPAACGPRNGRQPLDLMLPSTCPTCMATASRRLQLPRADARTASRAGRNPQAICSSSFSSMFFVFTRPSSTRRSRPALLRMRAESDLVREIPANGCAWQSRRHRPHRVDHGLRSRPPTHSERHELHLNMSLSSSVHRKHCRREP
jgi:hypothetical protein